LYRDFEDWPGRVIEENLKPEVLGCPSGYEPNSKKLSSIDFNAFSSCKGGKNQSNSPSFGPWLDPNLDGYATELGELICFFGHAASWAFSESVRVGF
jgi:hypothetical protein